MASSYCQVLFHFLLYHFCRSGLVVMNYLSFCLSGNLLVSPLFIKIVLPDIKHLVGKISFNTLNMSFHGLLDSMVSAEKLDVNFIEYPLHNKLLISLLSRFFVFGFQHFYYNVFQYNSFCVYPPQSFLSFLDL